MTKQDIKIKVPINFISAKKKANIAKHLRIAKQTYGGEKIKHLKIADKLLTRYGL
jgi:hypothetical protein